MQRNLVTVKIHAIITLTSLKIMVCTVNVDMPTHYDQIARNWAIFVQKLMLYISFCFDVMQSITSGANHISS